MNSDAITKKHKSDNKIPFELGEKVGFKTRFPMLAFEIFSCWLVAFSIVTFFSSESENTMDYKN